MSNAKTTFLVTIGAIAAAHLIISYVDERSRGESPDKTAVKEAVNPPSNSNIGKGSMALPSLPVNGNDRPRLDVAFCIDTTSSMQAEIDSVKSQVRTMVQKVCAMKGKPIVRVGLVAYRDTGDEYVKKIFPFSEDIDKVISDIGNLAAMGGGDGEEAVEVGLRAAVNDLKWSDQRHTAKLLYLIGDAPPHDDKFAELRSLAKEASRKGISINTIGCDGLQSYQSAGGGLNLFKKIAMDTNGTYEPLSYRQELVDAKGEKATYISSAGKAYRLKDGAEKDWKASPEALVASGKAVQLQGATNGTIGLTGPDATFVTGVNTAGTVRVQNNLGSMMIEGAQEAIDKMSK